MISVIIPLYNKSSTIIHTLDSIFTQTNQNFEIIIIDDGSTDDSLKKVSSITDKENLTIKSQTNKGVSAARNAGVIKARFSYIAFLDADDFWDINFIEIIIKAIKVNNYPDFISTGGRILNDKDVKSRLDKSRKIGDIFFANIFKNPYTYIHTSSVVIRKDVFLEVGQFPQSIKTNEDLACFFRIALQYKVLFINVSLSNYARNIAGQLSKINFSDLPVCFVQRVNYVHEYYLKNKLKNSDYLHFTSYEILDQYYRAIKNKDFDTVDYLNKNLSAQIQIDVQFPLKKIMNIGNNFFIKNVLLIYKIILFITK